MEKKRLLRIRERTICEAVTYNYVKAPVVPHGERWCLQHIAYENETGPRGTFRRYVDRGDYNDYLAELQGPGAAELITWDGELWLYEGDVLVIRQATCSASDVLSLYARGYKMFNEDSK